MSVLALVVALSASTITSGESALSIEQAEPFSVTSTLARRSVLPHAIRWVAVPAIASAKIKEVRFSIDGRLRWREQRSPYTYGGDGNALVTTWLALGAHRFTVEAISKNGERATTSTLARVRAPSSPPAKLAGAWTRILTKEEAGDAIDSAPGRWRLVIDKVGWRFRDPGTHGALVDVVYLSPGLIEARGGIYTGLPGPGLEGNVWCDEPFQPVRYRWAVEGSTLTLRLVGAKRCDGQSNVWARTWARP